MKRIIDGRRYDTSTAEEIATATHGYKSEFSYYEETLYCKRTGEYFLYGYGHGESKYAKQVLGDWGPGEDIIPMDYGLSLFFHRLSSFPSGSLVCIRRVLWYYL